MAIPAELAAALRPTLPALAEEVIAAIAAEVPDYRRPMEGRFGRNVRRGVEIALGRFLEGVASPSDRLVYVELGRGEFREGRSLDALLRAYRVGARVAWRRCVEAGRAADVEPEVLYELGESMFEYIDGLSAESSEGWAAAQSEAAGERARDRRRLVRLLLQPPPPDEASVRASAERAAWPLPATLAAVVTEAADPGALASRLGSGVIAAEDGDAAAASGDGAAPPADPATRRVVALVPDPDAPLRRTELEAALGDTPAALGPAVAWADASASAGRARLAHRLVAAGVLPGPFTVADDHLPVLLLHADERLVNDLASAALAPLGALPPGPRAKLTATLRAWLDHRGRVEETATALGVHPQTVRYRLGQLRESFGERLEDADARFALELALRARDAQN